MDTGARISSSVVFFIGVFLGGILMLFYVTPTIIDMSRPTEILSESNIVVFNDREYFEILDELIGSAESSIHMVMFEIKYYDKYPNSDVNQLVERLIERNSAGVDVRIIVDQFLTDSRAVEIFEKTGVDIKWDSTKLTTHSKLLIIDGRIVVVGSTNWSYYSFSKNHESNVVIYDKETAKKFEEYFELVWLES